MTIGINTDTATVISAFASLVYAGISAISLWLLSRQIRDARRFGAAPALYALLKELEEHMTAVRQLGPTDLKNSDANETISRCLEFFERVEHLRSAGVIPVAVLRRAFGGPLQAYLADARFTHLIQHHRRQHQEVLTLARHIVPRQ